MEIKNFLFEEWRPIRGYEGLYEVSNYGRVRSLPNRGTMGKFNNGKLKIPQKRGRYLYVRLYKNGQSASFSVHRLVAEAFIPNPNNYPVVDHIDTDTHNNKSENLRWTTHSGNSNNPISKKHMIENRDAKGGKRSSQKVYAKKGTEFFEYPSQNEAARKTGVSRRHIWACLNGKQKAANGYIFSKTPLI